MTADDRQPWAPTISRASTDAPPPAPEGPPGARIGRFELLRVLGEGGMGRVHLGYDPQLEREVAIKVLRSSAGEPRRLLREAQALARLSHPNVVQVHEAGTDGGSVYLVMEYVPGHTLGEWAREQPEWRVRASRLVQAGRGLAAAHAAGLVHRDFKPDNVLVGEDGRARVLDFGLVKRELPSGANESMTSAELLETEADTPADEQLTLRGTIMGTSAYMAPEQHEGRPCDAAADQFAFCVTAYELLYDQAPFGRGRLRQLAEAKLEGRVLEPPRDSPVPRAVRELVLRGLCAAPQQRWPSMDALLDKFEHVLDPPVPPRWPALLGLGASGLVALGLALRSEPDPTPSCAADPQALAGVWDEPRRGLVREGLLRSSIDARVGEALFEQASVSLDTWAQLWTRERQASCRATWAEAAQSEPLLDRRELCFSRQRAEFDALISVFESGDPKLVMRLDALLSKLPDLGACSPAALAADAETPLDPPAQAQAQTAYAALARARALVRLGQVETARQLMNDAGATGEALELPALRIEAEAALASQAIRAGELEAGVEALRTQALAARAAGLHELEASVRVTLARHLAGKFAQPRLERWAIEEAALVVESVARPKDPREVSLAVARARLAEQAGDFEAAAAAHEQAYALAEGRLTPTARAGLRIGMGTSRYGMGDYAGARTLLQDALAQITEDWGPWSPKAAHIHFNLALIEADLGEHASARAHMDAALELDAALWGPDSLEYARDQYAAAYLDFASGELRSGCARVDALLPTYEARLGSAHDETGQLLSAVGMCALAADDDAAALAAYERARAILLPTLGEDHLELALLDANIAEVELVRGELERAGAGYDSALERFVASVGEAHPILAHALRGQGSVALARGEVERALPLLERALELADASNALELAELRFALARALIAARGEAELARARGLALDAQRVFRRAETPRQLDAAQAWLERHRVPRQDRAPQPDPESTP